MTRKQYEMIAEDLFVLLGLYDEIKDLRIWLFEEFQTTRNSIRQLAEAVQDLANAVRKGHEK
jgi:hypothetical protein